MLDCIQNEKFEIIATLTQSDVREFEELHPEVLGKLTRWLDHLDDLLNWLVKDKRDDLLDERGIAIDEFLKTGFFEE